MGTQPSHPDLLLSWWVFSHKAICHITRVSVRFQVGRQIEKSVKINEFWKNFSYIWYFNLGEKCQIPMQSTTAFVSCQCLLKGCAVMGYPKQRSISLTTNIVVKSLCLETVTFFCRWQILHQIMFVCCITKAQYCHLLSLFLFFRSYFAWRYHLSMRAKKIYMLIMINNIIFVAHIVYNFVRVKINSILLDGGQTDFSYLIFVSINRLFRCSLLSFIHSRIHRLDDLAMFVIQNMIKMLWSWVPFGCCSFHFLSCSRRTFTSRRRSKIFRSLVKTFPILNTFVFWVFVLLWPFFALVSVCMTRNGTIAFFCR